MKTSINYDGTQVSERIYFIENENRYLIKQFSKGKKNNIDENQERIMHKLAY